MPRRCGAAREAEPGAARSRSSAESARGDLRRRWGTGADRLLLDNMDPAQLRVAVAARDAAAKAHGPMATLEASGGITLGNVAEVAATGVDFVSVGALTHSAPALDLSMLLEPA